MKTFVFLTILGLVLVSLAEISAYPTGAAGEGEGGDAPKETEGAGDEPKEAGPTDGVVPNEVSGAAAPATDAAKPATGAAAPATGAAAPATAAAKPATGAASGVTKTAGG